jgi:PEP-CTERM motif
LTFDPDFGAGDFVELEATLAAGTYVIGYGQEAVQQSLSGSKKKVTSSVTTGGQTPGTTQSTPFTFAGLVQVPEPGTLTLLVPGIALIMARRRRPTTT